MSLSEKIPIRISVVSYLNSKPFLHGLKNFVFEYPVEITEDIPSQCANKILTGKADIGLVPVAILTENPDLEIISEYCIGSDGRVESVLLVSQVPLNEIKTVLLDYQSRTSVLLARVLAREYWKITPTWIDGEEFFEKNIGGNTAGVIIGDRALLLKESYQYVYDLSEEWKKLTLLPFVYACWVSNKTLDKEFIDEFNKALSDGLGQIDEIAALESTLLLPKETIVKYLKESIQYKLDNRKKDALSLFLQKAAEIKKVKQYFPNG